jgi:hypothetical protein
MQYSAMSMKENGSFSESQLAKAISQLASETGSWRTNASQLMSVKAALQQSETKKYEAFEDSGLVHLL